MLCLLQHPCHSYTAKACTPSFDSRVAHQWPLPWSNERSEARGPRPFLQSSKHVYVDSQHVETRSHGSATTRSHARCCSFHRTPRRTERVGPRPGHLARHVSHRQRAKEEKGRVPGWGSKPGARFTTPGGLFQPFTLQNWRHWTSPHSRFSHSLEDQHVVHAWH